MFATGPSSSGSTTFESNIPRLDVPAMIKPILKNYDSHVNNFIRFLKNQLKFHLVYEGHSDIRQHILQKSVYALSVYCKPKKILKDVFPVMIGSRLDIAIRHCKMRSFTEPFDLSDSKKFPFQELDIGTGFFIINGFLRQLPYFFTNDPTNTHVVRNKMVRVYSYNSQDRGKELSFYLMDIKSDNKNIKERKCGDVVIIHNDGSESNHDPYFFNHCPYPVDLTAYMNHLYKDEQFDIDHLGNKMVISPGHMFTKLFIKYLYGPLREQDWKLVKSRAALVRTSIENGYLLHVLSRKTVYFKEAKSAGKMTNEPQETHREIGANGEVFMEKNVGCYREISTQTYPLNPYLLYLIVRQLSKKVDNSKIDSFHSSYLYFLCILGIFETKNVGRTTMMVRDTLVSTCDDLDPVYHDSPSKDFWDFLNLVPEKGSSYYVVVNEACIPVTKNCFDSMNLTNIKFHFKKIECYGRGRFIIIRYKMGLIMKKMPELPIWVTPYDIRFWCERLFRGNIHFNNFPSLTSYFVDLNPFFNFTAFPKIMLGFNSLKNSVLATTSKYTFYFMDTLSTYYTRPSPNHKVLLEPKNDSVSRYFVMMLHQPIVAYMSFKGCTQEDCIVKRASFDAFDCSRFYTLRLKIEASPTTWVKFHPVRGDQDPESELLGTLISGEPIKIESISNYTRLEEINPNEYRLYFSKTPFRMIQHYLTGDLLIISLEQQHTCSTGDKLCSLHGQKGVIRVFDKVPLMDGTTKPDLIVNAYCMFRCTAGQILEGFVLGGGKDSIYIINTKGKLIKGEVFYAKTYYFQIVYWSSEHLYAPKKCTNDRITLAPVKGRSRNGGMKIGTMELNAIRAQGLAAFLAEKLSEHGDMTIPYGIPKSLNLVAEDMKCFKMLLKFVTREPVEMEIG